MLECFLNRKFTDRDDLYYNSPDVSPDQIGDEVLRNYPQTYLLGGSRDYMTIESICLANRLYNLGIKVKYDLIKDMSHAFVYFSMIMPDVRNLK